MSRKNLYKKLIEGQKEFVLRQKCELSELKRIIDEDVEAVHNLEKNALSISESRYIEFRKDIIKDYTQKIKKIDDYLERFDRG